MTEKELAQLEKKAVFTMRADPTIKDQVVNANLNQLTQLVKREVKRNKILVLIAKLN
jgi:hypothetical protein